MNNRREFITKAVALAAAATALPLLPASATPLVIPSLKGRKVLVTYGGWDGHEPAKWADYISSWLKDEGADVQSFNSLDPYTDKTLMSGIDLIIQQWTMSQISKEQEAGLLEAVRENGTGMAGWHGGMGDAFRNNTEYQFMTGGQWVAHPGGQVDYDVHIIDSKDEVTKGLKDFHLKSEQYYMHVDPNVKVLATTKFNGATNSWIDGAVLPVTWKKFYGKGRIFYTSLGHNVSHITGIPGALEMMRRGIKWAGASKYEPMEKWMSPVYKY
ncbi:MAG: ThuA domain-containing protein [Bacteroidota bacterium]